MDPMEARFTMTPEVERTLRGPKKKVEYVVCCPVDIEVEVSSGVIHHPQEIRERIVRCRDCAHCEHVTYEELKGRFGTVPPREVYRCWRPGEYRQLDVDPEGFCAWGEERDA